MAHDKFSLPSWEKPPAVLELKQDDAHLWRAHENSLELQLGRAMLNLEEKARADRFRFPVHRERFVIYRAVLRTILGQYLGMNSRDVPLEVDLRGKPVITTVGGNFHFNISHSVDWLTVACCRGSEIGVDVENVNKRVQLLEIAERYFLASEQEQLRTCPEIERPLRFFEMWTAREAVLKAEGIGLGGLQNVAKLAEAWRLVHFCPASEFVGAVALREMVRLTGCFDFSANGVAVQRPEAS